ncbi:MFS transporter [Priestia megaterium]|uniref:MFS transporter n=1 Tax=Priestia megaterium TaxID=1404 RepID=UPI0011A55592|nr:MFS transporter [Priestia megaterium]
MNKLQQLSLFDNRALLWLLSVLFTNFGLGGYTLITGVILYDMTGSGMIFATTLGVGFALDLVGQFFGGGVLDRINPRIVAFFANFSRGALIILSGLFIYITNSVIGVVVVTLYMGIIGPIYRATAFSIAPLIVEKNKLPNFNAIRMVVMQVGQLLGLALTSSLLTFITQDMVFILVGIWFVLGGVTTLLIKGMPDRKNHLSNSRLSPLSTVRQWLDLFENFKSIPSVYFHIFIASSGLLIPTLINLSVVPLNSLLFGNPLGLMLLDGGFTVGAILAATIITKYKNFIRNTKSVINISLICSGIFILVSSYVSSIFMATLCFFMVGMMSTVASISLDTSLQIRIHTEILGRTAIFQDGFMSLIAISLIPYLGSIIDNQGIDSALSIGSYFIFGYALIAIILGSRLVFGRKMYEETIPLTNEKGA